MSHAKVESIGVAAERARIETEAQQRAAREVKGRADVLSLKLYHLEDVAHLAAFAAESRRVLETLEDIKQIRPGMREVISTGISDADQWSALKDVAAGVLNNLAQELHEINHEFLAIVYDLADSKAGCTNGKTTQERD